MERNVDALLNTLDSTAGVQLRAVFEYESGGGGTIHYVRDGIVPADVRRRSKHATRIFRAARDAYPDDDEFPVSTPSLHVFGPALCVNLPDPDGGVGVTLDYDSGVAFLDFLTECADAVRPS